MRMLLGSSTFFGLTAQHQSRKEHFIPQKTWDVAIKWILGFQITVVKAAAILMMVTTSLSVIVVISDGFLHCKYKLQKIMLSCEPTKYGSCSSCCLLGKKISMPLI